LWRRLEAFETLARVDTLFIDKTGTLTEDRLALRNVHRVDEPGRGAAPRCDAIDAPSPFAPGPAPTDCADRQRRMLEQAAALAGWSTHPLSRALVVAAGDASESTACWSEVTETPGCGLQARGADGQNHRLGSRAWVQGEAGAASPSLGSTDSPHSSVWFGPHGHPLAVFEFEEKLRDGSEAALQRLRAAGVRVVLLSGDRADAVQSFVRRLNLDGAVAEATPQSKLDTLARAQAQGHVVAMAGDGLNDAPVLARADVSFAFAHGSAMIQSHSDAVVLANRLQDVAFAFELARRSVRVVRQNLAWAVTYNAACIPLALLGWLPPWAAGLGMALSSLAVVLNSMRLARR
jgi:Cu2+-exporting ATPase